MEPSHSDADEVILVEVDPAAEAFYAGAYRRMQSVIMTVGVAGTVLALPLYGWRVGGGFVLGAALAYLNFVWLKQSIIGLTNRLAAQQGAIILNETAGETAPERRGVAFKFVFRYLVIAAVAYAIISSSSLNVFGLIAGFFLSVVALLFEAVAEVVYALRHCN
jgi:hypothetical protein